MRAIEGHPAEIMMMMMMAVATSKRFRREATKNKEGNRRRCSVIGLEALQADVGTG